MYCTNCGKFNPEDSAFCEGCGTPIEVHAPALQAGRRTYNQSARHAPVARPETKNLNRQKCRPSAAVRFLSIALAIILGIGIGYLFGSGLFRYVEYSRPLKVTRMNVTPPEDCVTQLYQLSAGTKAAQASYTFSDNIGNLQLDEGEILVAGIGLGYGTDSSGNEVLFYMPVEAEIKNGVASAAFIPADYLEAKTEVRGSGGNYNRPVEGLVIGFFRNYAFQRPGGNNSTPGSFRVLASSADIRLGFMNAEIADGVLTDLENAYQYYIDQGYSFSPRKLWPIDVKMAWLGDSNGEYVPIKTLQFSTLALNLKLFSGYQSPSDSIRTYNAGDNYPLVVHEMGHFMQHCYTSLALNCVWTDEAAATYYEWKTGGDISDALALGKLQTLDGVYPWVSTMAHGYGRMPLFLYLEEYVKHGFIHSLYTGTSQGYGTNFQWCGAITELCGNPDSYAADYYHKLLTGELVYSYSARDIYFAIKNNYDEGKSLGVAAGLNLPEAGTRAETLFSDGRDNIVLGTYNVSAYRYGTQFLAIYVASGSLPEGTDLWVTGSGNCNVSAYCIKAETIVLPGDGKSVVLDDFTSKTSQGCVYLVQLVGLHDSRLLVDNGNYKLTVLLGKNYIEPSPSNSSADSSTGVSPSDGVSPGNGSSDAGNTASDCCADAIPEVAGVHFERMDDNIPNARSGSICQAPGMRIDAFSIIGGRLTAPKMNPMVNEAFIYSNKGYCVVGETIGLEMSASARDREHDGIEYNILQNQLTVTITFYDKSGKIIGTPETQKSPDNAKDHTISGGITAVVPDNAASVSIIGSFSHKYGSYGNINGSSVTISINYSVCG